MNKRISALLTILLVLLAVTVPVSAREVPNFQIRGSLKLQMVFDGEPLDSGSLSLYRVGTPALSGENAIFTLVETLSNGPDLSDLDSPELARQLADLAIEKNLSSLEASITHGSADFSNLECGLYVVTQQSSQATPEFDAIQPFLISLPQWLNGTYVYHLTAAPKIPLVPLETIPIVPTEPTKPTAPSHTSILPQTGQLNWPIPVLAVLGMTFFIAGWILRHRRQHHEK